jgi:hypothetical protein
MNYQITFYLFYGLTAVTIFTVFYYTIKFSLTKKKIKKESEEATSALIENFENFRQGIEDQVDRLERKDSLTPEEKIDYEKLKDALDHSKSYINKKNENADEDL